MDDVTTKPMKIIIIGGGTAGWMTAAALANHTDHDITMVSGGDPIGVGESTTPHINQYLRFMGISDEQMIKNARATFKLSSRFVDFNEVNGVFHYPNGQNISGDVTFQRWMVAKAYADPPPFAEVMMPFTTVVENGKLPLNTELLGTFDLNHDRAFHIDAAAFSKYLRDRFCERVTVVDSKVKSVRATSRGISSIVVDRGEFDIKPKELTGDLYIDCSGRESVALGPLSPWAPFHNLINDRALVTTTEYEDKEVEMVPYTNAQGMSAGWQWTIPTWDYISRGYVFSSKHQSEEDARKEFGYEDAKLINFESGMRIQAWAWNCVGLGMSYGFIEPLESTSLFNTAHGILALCKILQEGTPGRFARERFNKDLRDHMEGWREFVEAHYYYSSRRDTPYWREVTEEIHYTGGAHDVVLDMMVHTNEVEHGKDPIVFILTGHGYTCVDVRKDEFHNQRPIIPDVSRWWKKHDKICKSEFPTMHSYISSRFAP
tara:strand:- start:299 stop:1762 length:1464 start_codon:yes stop_codon:yes gene_type:complete